MSNSISGQINCNLNLKNTYPATSGSFAESVNLGQVALQITGGTGINQCNEMWSSTLSLAAATTTLDLTNLTGIGSRVVTFSAIKVLYIVNNDSVAAHSVAVGNGASTPWYAPFSASTHTHTIPGGASGATATSGGTPFLITNLTAAGWAVDGSHNLLMLDPGANTVSVTILIAGLA